MKRQIIFFLLSLLLLIPLQPHRIFSSSFEPSLNNTNLKGVVVIDDEHGNDYFPDNMVDVVKDLDKLGFLVYYSSELGGLEQAITKAHYLIINAPNNNYTVTEINAINTWFSTGARNLLIASRGDYSNRNIATVNNLLSTLGASIRLQHDNIYTTDPSVFRPWYIRTSNFANTTYPNLFENVNVIDFFSPSSITSETGGNVDFIIYAEPEAYQSDENPPPPEVIYDNTDDGVGGDSIPLAGLEIVNNGDLSDRVVAVGTTLWSDYDYVDQNEFDDINFLHNVMTYFYQETLKLQGSIEINVPDEVAPTVKIAFPRNNSIVKGTVNITLDAFDKFGVTNYGIYINGDYKTNSSYYLWDTTSVSNGVYNITAVAYDEAGNIGRTTHFVTVDQNHVPTLPSQVKIMTYNIKESGIKPGWIDVVKEENPDIIVFVETGAWDDNNNALLNKYLDELNYYFQDLVPYTGYTEQGAPASWTGIAIFSRFPVIKFTEIGSLTLDDGSTITPSHKFLHASIEIHNSTINIIGAHLTAFADPDNEKQREKEQEGINNYMDKLGEVPLIYAGDLNSESPQDYWNSDLGKGPISMLLNRTDTRRPKYHLFTDVYRYLHPDAKANPGYTFGGYSRIDYIFTNQFLTPLVLSSTIGDTPSALEGSDHFSVDAILDFSNGIYYGAPGPVEQLTATLDASKKEVFLSWQAPLVTFTLPISGYKVYRSTTPDGNFELLATLDSKTTTYKDTSIDTSKTTTYYYKVVALNEHGEGMDTIVQVKISAQSQQTSETKQEKTSLIPTTSFVVLFFASFITLRRRSKSP